MNNGNGHVDTAIQAAGKVCVITICADIDAISAVARVTTQLFSSPVVGNMTRYLPQNQDLSLLREMQYADVCICVIDCDVDRALAIETVTSLRHLLGSKAVPIAISRKSTSGLVLDAMRAGCVEYLSKPLEAEQLTQALIRLRLRWNASEAAEVTSQVLAFLGVRGGAGATTVAIHLAAFLVQLCGKKTLIIDQQRQLGHVALYMGLPTPKYHFYDLARNVNRLDIDFLRSFVQHAGNGVDVIPAPDELFAVTDATVDDVHKTVRFLRTIYEYIIIDCPHGLGRLNVATVDEADKLFVVATPDIPALRDLSRYVDRLSQYHFPPGKLNVVLNRFRSKGEVGLEQITKGIKQPVAVTIPNSSSELIDAMNLGKPLVPGGNSEFSRQMRKWACTLAPSGEAVAEAPKEKRKHALAFWS
ncbi:MAG: AAA family ATPase [Candidatus Korobacteraceae bacterium]